MATPVLQSLDVTPQSVIALGVLMPLLSIIMVSTRLYLRVTKATPVGVDDLLVVFATIICTGLGIMMIVGNGPKGFMFEVTEPIVVSLKMKFVTNVTQPWAFGAVKLSVLFFYRRIFRGRTFMICNYTLMGIVIAWLLSFFFTWLFACGTHFDNNWGGGLFAVLTKCTPQSRFQQAMAVSDVLVDCLILVLPIPMVWRLQLVTSRKIAVIGIFILGAGAVAASITRLVIWQSQLSSAFSSSQGIEFITSWIYFTELELGISIMAACMPTMKPLLGGLSPETLSKFRSIFSLRSLSSRGSRNGPQTHKRAGSETRSDSTRSHPTESYATENKAYASHYSTSEPMPPLPNQVYMENTVHTSVENQV